jgi:hypothetical protein
MKATSEEYTTDCLCPDCEPLNAASLMLSKRITENREDAKSEYRHYAKSLDNLDILRTSDVAYILHKLRLSDKMERVQRSVVSLLHK